MTQEKLTLFHAHEAIETMFTPGGVVAEGRDSQCLPGILVPKDPLVAIKGLAQKMSRTPPEVFAEAVEPSEISTLSRRIPAGDRLRLQGPAGRRDPSRRRLPDIE